VDKQYVFDGPNGKETLSELFKKRMGWSFKWVSSFQSDFNFDYQASFTPALAMLERHSKPSGPSPIFSPSLCSSSA
jgi:predicted dithiol-disulfide oxidoreductase (DUF899 family)